MRSSKADRDARKLARIERERRKALERITPAQAARIRQANRAAQERRDREAAEWHDIIVKFDRVASAKVAAAIKAELQRSFPGVEFKINYRTSQTSFPSTVTVRWREPIEDAAVGEIVSGALLQYRTRS